MAKDEQTVKVEIKDYIEKYGSYYANWYVGIAEDPRERLFNEHNVNENGDYWIYRQCTSSDAARRIEEYFVEILGIDGGTGGGSDYSDYVYAYKKSPHSIE